MTKYHIDKDKVGEFWRNHSAKFQLNENSGLSKREWNELMQSFEFDSSILK